MDAWAMGCCGVWYFDARRYFDTTIKLCRQVHSSGKRAKDQLYGVCTLILSWIMLSKKFGDKHLISKKIKSQLKSFQTKGEGDSERVINLRIKERNIVTRLEMLGMD